jgi:hypothetical protein
VIDGVVEGKNRTFDERRPVDMCTITEARIIIMIINKAQTRVEGTVPMANVATRPQVLLRLAIFN